MDFYLEEIRKALMTSVCRTAQSQVYPEDEFASLKSFPKISFTYHNTHPL